MKPEGKENAWFTTSSGRMFFPWRPDELQVNLEDLAHTLSQINRWGGHTRVPYSVAQHSIFVAECCPVVKRAWGFLHDTTEAYMGGDIVSPIKRNVPDLVALEAGIAEAITDRFGLPRGALDDREVKEADLLVLAWEYRDLMPLTLTPGVGGTTPLPMSAYRDAIKDFPTITAWTARHAEEAFLEYAGKLGLS